MNVITDAIVPVVTAGTAVGVLLLNGSVSKLDSEMKRREQDRQDRLEERLVGQQSTDLRFRVYDAVTGSLASSDARRQRVAIALVSAVLAAEDSLRASLLTVLQAEGAPEVRAQASAFLNQTRTFTLDQQDLSLASLNFDSGSDWRRYRIDVFWCESSGQRAKDQAEQLARHLRAQGATGTVRERILASSINASPGYGIAGHVIRREEGEEPAAKSLKVVTDAALNLSAPGFALTRSRSPTPGYLSAFVCP